jgi:hypothetical protein
MGTRTNLMASLREGFELCPFGLPITEGFNLLLLHHKFRSLDMILGSLYSQSKTNKPIFGPMRNKRLRSLSGFGVDLSPDIGIENSYYSP